MVQIDIINKENALEGLETLIEHFYKDKPNTVDLEDMAFRLSRVVGKTPEWGWRYIRNVLNDKIDPSVKMRQAIQILCLALDDVPPLIARSKDITGTHIRVLLDENIEPGTVIMVSSQKCKRPGCIMNFTRRGPNHKFCSDECRKIVAKMKVGE